MKPVPAQAAGLSQPSRQRIVISGAWTARGIAAIESATRSLRIAPDDSVIADGAGVVAMDSAGAWVLHQLLERLRGGNVVVTLTGLGAPFAKLLAVVDQQALDQAAAPVLPPRPRASLTERVGRSAAAVWAEAGDLVVFVGENAGALLRCVQRPSRFRWRTILYNLRGAGIAALPIVALLSFMLGVVVAYQGADQLRQYGGSIFVVDLIGLSMLREFAPLITAIILAGRSGSAFAAQIGTMAVTEELDAMRTLGIPPLEQLVLPKLIAMVAALPLLTVAADFFGVAGGMLMAQAQLGVTPTEFLDRFPKAVSVTAYLVGIGKAPVFAGIIAVVGCFQGFRARGGADGVGRQTTRAVVQSIFLVIVTDGLFSVAFSALDI